MTSEIETFLILKYGSIQDAYQIWYWLMPAEQDKVFTNAQHDFLCAYEYDMVANGTGPYKPVGIQ